MPDHLDQRRDDTLARGPVILAHRVCRTAQTESQPHGVIVATVECNGPHRRDLRHPAARASASDEKQRSPFDVMILVRS